MPLLKHIINLLLYDLACGTRYGHPGMCDASLECMQCCAREVCRKGRLPLAKIVRHEASTRQRLVRVKGLSLWRCCRLIMVTLPFATQETKCLAYKMLIRPIIEYAKIVWDPFTVTSISKFEKIQCLAVWFIFNKYQWTDSPSQLCALSELPTNQARTKYERLKYLYLVINHHVHIRYADYFDILHSETSRHCHSMFVRAPAVHTDSYKYSFFPRAINEWNSLADEAVSCSSTDLFIKHIAHFLICS